jgi:hypothetical protein
MYTILSLVHSLYLSHPRVSSHCYEEQKKERKKRSKKKIRREENRKEERKMACDGLI